MAGRPAARFHHSPFWYNDGFLRVTNHEPRATAFSEAACELRLANCGRKAIFIERRVMKVYLNAGHDRELDPGAVNRRLHLRECDAAYELALGVQQYLERNGIAVVFGQDDDLYHICDQANQAECDLFVSIHFNAYNGRASGTETLISGSTGSLMLGHCIQTNLKAVLNLPNRGLKERPDSSSCAIPSCLPSSSKSVSSTTTSTGAVTTPIATKRPRPSQRVSCSTRTRCKGHRRHDERRPQFAGSIKEDAGGRSQKNTRPKALCVGASAWEAR